MIITGFYTSLLAIIFVWLSLRTINERRNAKVALGDGGNVQLLRLMRRHANFAEYIPLTLLLFALAEFNGTYSIVLHALGSILIIGRIIHAYGVGQVEENINLRVIGMMITFTVILILALTNLSLFALKSYG